MTNEELVGLIQGGDREQFLQLWAKVQGIARKEAHRWAAYRSGGAELEDLEQAGFIALMRAVDSFDSSAGVRFSTWYYPIMKDEFQRATGRRTAKQAKDPLQQAGSLDEPVGDDEDGAALVELVADSSALLAFERAEERQYRAQLRAALGEALGQLPAHHRSIIRRRFYRGQTFSAIAAEMGIQPEIVRKWEGEALKLLRHPRISRSLMEYLPGRGCNA